jgi:hypothetical protein
MTSHETSNTRRTSHWFVKLRLLSVLEKALNLNKAPQGCDVGRVMKRDLCMIMGNLAGN